MAPSSKKHGPRMSVNPLPATLPIKITHKKRSKSLGGPTLEHEAKRGALRDADTLTLSLELTPRKKARRSLVPGKSILKSRPTITGLETGSIDQASLAHPRLSVPLQVIHDSSNLRDSNSGTLSEYQNPTRSQINTNDDHDPGSDVSSDMDVSDGAALNRSSLGSNPTTLLRRVSFAAKAHVRTFGSPIADPDSSALSPNLSHPNQDPGPSTNSPSRVSEPESLEDESTDMSIDQSFVQDQPTTHKQADGGANDHRATAPQVHNQPQQHKASRLSTAIPGFGDYNDDDDDGDMSMADVTLGEVNLEPSEQEANEPSSNSRRPDQRPSDSLPPANKENFSDALGPSIQVTLTNAKATVKPSFIPRPSVILKNRPQSLSAEKLNKLKSSRLSVALPEYMRWNETDFDENMEDLTIDPPLPGESQESLVSTTRDPGKVRTSELQAQQPDPPDHQKKASRLTDFFGFVEDDATVHVDQPLAHPSAESLRQDATPLDKSIDTQTSPLVSAAYSNNNLIDFDDLSNQDHHPKIHEATQNSTQSTEPSGPLQNVSNEVGIAGPLSIGTPKYVGMTDRGSVQSNNNNETTSGPSGYLNPSQDDSRHVETIKLSQESALRTKPMNSKASRLSSFFPDAEISAEGVSLSITDPEIAQPSEGPESLNALVDDSASNHLNFDQANQTINLPRFASHQISRRFSEINSASPSRRLSASPSKRAYVFPSPRRSIGPISPRPSVPTSLPTTNLASKSLLPVDSGTTRDPFAAQNLRPDDGHVENIQAHSAPDHSLGRESMPAIKMNLNEFFDKAEIKFISLSQPRVRDHDQQEQSASPGNIQQGTSFAQQVYAGMVKIPRLRMLESSAKILRQKTEILDNTVKENERIIENNPTSSGVLRNWLNLQQRKEVLNSQSDTQANQKHLDEVNELMNKLRLKKDWVELSSKQDGHRFELETRQSYHDDLLDRREKLKKDLVMMRKMCDIVEPSIETWRTRKQSLIEEIRRRKQKNAEIENCDQNALKSLKEEAKELVIATEANRSALAESDFERNIWLAKLTELREEKEDHLKKLDQLKRGPDQSQRCTVQELVRLRNEFLVLQSMMGWHLVRLANDTMEMKLVNKISVAFHFSTRNQNQPYRQVEKIELIWDPPKSNEDGDDIEQQMIEEFFFSHLKQNFHGQNLKIQMKDLMQQITSIWNHVRQLTYEILNLRSRFRITLRFSPETRTDRTKTPGTMKVIAAIQSSLLPTSLDAEFEFTGEEISDWKTEKTICNVSAKVTCLFGKANCQNLVYVIQEHIDRGDRGALKEACEEALASLDSGSS